MSKYPSLSVGGNEGITIVIDGAVHRIRLHSKQDSLAAFDAIHAYAVAMAQWHTEQVATVTVTYPAPVHHAVKPPETGK